MIKNQLARAAFAEFVATALFVWIGCGSAYGADAGLLSIATAFGFAISVLAYSIGHISGGHINPAVSFALFLLGEVDMQTMFVYIIAQMGGAVLGAFLLWGCFAGYRIGPPVYGVNSLTEGGSEVYGITQASGFLIEVMGTYLLVFTVCMTAVHKKSGAGNVAPIAIGWSVMMAHIVMIPITGCGINPARSFGPVFVNSVAGFNTWSEGCWIFYTAPFVGAGLAAMTYLLAFAECDEEGGEKENLIQETATTEDKGEAKKAEVSSA